MIRGLFFLSTSVRLEREKDEYTKKDFIIKSNVQYRLFLSTQSP